MMAGLRKCYPKNDEGRGPDRRVLTRGANARVEVVGPLPEVANASIQPDHARTDDEGDARARTFQTDSGCSR